MKLVKKLSVGLASLLILLSFQLSTYAMENVDSELTLNDAGKIAVLFIANTMNETEGHWNSETKINKIVPLYGLDREINAYSFELSKNYTDNGYVVVSTNPNQKLIQEFSYSAEPIYSEIENEISKDLGLGIQSLSKVSNLEEDKVYYLGGLQYYISNDEKSYLTPAGDIESIENIQGENRSMSIESNQEIDNSETIEQIKGMTGFNLEEWMVGYNGQKGDSGYGNIYDPFVYLQDKYGSGYSINRMSTLSYIKPLLQNELENGANNCSLSVLTTIFEYYRNIGYTKINSSVKGLYNDIRAIGVTYGYTPTGGTGPTKMNNIVNDIWKKYGYSGSGSNQYVFSFDTFTSEIDSNRPTMFNLSSGYYSNHSITVVGYREYKKSSSSNLHFLKVFDNWTTDDRFVDYDVLIYNSFGSVTLVRP